MKRKLKMKDGLKFILQSSNSPRFLRAARCTNAGAFVLLPLTAFALRGSEASELGFCSTLIAKS